MKSFVIMLVAISGLAIALGGSFLAGLSLGKNNENQPMSNLSLQAPKLGGQTDSLPDGTPLQQIQSLIQSGAFTQEDFAQLRQLWTTQMRGSGGALSSGSAGSGSSNSNPGNNMRGTISKLEGNIITLNTTQGDLQVHVSGDTTIRATALVEISELSNGMTLTVTGERGEDGTFKASSIFSLPEGMQGFGGGSRGGFGGGGRGGFGGGGRGGTSGN